MSFKDALRRAVVEGFAGMDMPAAQVIVILFVTFALGAYLYLVYRLVNRQSVYDRSFHTAMPLISVVTAGIIIAMQSSIVISLGMVGALSIVRFRTAIKDPMDLLFLFWSISEGIICGAGLFEVALIVALVVTIGLLLLQYLPEVRKPFLLMTGGASPDYEEPMLACLKEHCRDFRVKSRNIRMDGLDMVVEVRTEDERALMQALCEIGGLERFSLLTQDGEVRI